MNRLTPIASALLALSTVAPTAWSQSAPTRDAAAAGTAAAAATTPATAGGLMGVQEVEIQGEAGQDFTRKDASLNKLSADLRDVPQSVTVLSKSLLQSQGASSLSDALRNIPGVTLGGAEGGQIGNNINLNGFTARTDIYLDGFRDRGQYYRDTFALDAVEVLMGTVVDAVRPRIHRRRRQPSQQGGPAQAGDRGRRVGDDQRHGAHDGRCRPGDRRDLGVRVAAMAQSGRTSTRDEMKNTDFGLAPSVKHGIGTDTEITLSALLQKNHDMPDYGFSPWQGRPVNAPHDDFYGYRDDRTDQDVATFSALVSQSSATT